MIKLFFLFIAFFFPSWLQAQDIAELEELLAYRVETNPLNIVSTSIFLCAIVHTLCARKIHACCKSSIFRFLGEIEIIFGLWVIPLLLSIAWLYNWQVGVDYLSGRDYTEAIAIVAIMILASSHPILNLVEQGMKKIASCGNYSVTAWWLTLLTIGPILGSFITEAGAMMITSLLLAKKLYSHPLSPKFAYATLGLLFTNVSIGGVLTSFASPPVLIVSAKWNWDSIFMLTSFGWKAVLTIVITNLCYFFYFRKELKSLGTSPTAAPAIKTPLWITLTHIAFLIFTVINLHSPIIIIGLFLIFLGFLHGTRTYQTPLKLRPALLVGFFFAGLIVHGGLQEWWIEPLLGSVSGPFIMTISIILGPFVDNAALAYLATFIPNLADSAKYLFLVGAIAAGGLTIIANAPNPAGYQVLSPFFKGGISAKRLFLGALFPMCLSLVIFLLFC